jgi:hypothetical protein
MKTLYPYVRIPSLASGVMYEYKIVMQNTAGFGNLYVIVRPLIEIFSDFFLIIIGFSFKRLHSRVRLWVTHVERPRVGSCLPRRRDPAGSGFALAVTSIFVSTLLLAGPTFADGAARAAGLRADRGGDAPLLVVAVGNDPADADRFEAWLGRPLDGVQLHNGRADWADWLGSIGWLIDLWADRSRTIFWSIQLLPNGADLAQGAAGTYDGYYAEAARQIAAGQPEGLIFVRTGWEFNGDWMPWAAKGREKEYIATYRNLVRQFRGASDRFVFEWSPNVGNFGIDPGAAWPGDDVVDVIGIDFYYQPQWDSADPEVAWGDMVARPYGLAWHRDFAAARGKPRAFSEWGVTLDDAGPYVRSAGAWFRQEDVVYQSYWNSDADFRGKLSDGRLPRAGEAYRETFGR